MQITFRTPCTYHKNCDETSVAFLHNRSAKDGNITDEEWNKACHMCEGMSPKIRKSLLETGSWKCPICGFEHKLVDGKIVPTLSQWYGGLSVTPR